MSDPIKPVSDQTEKIHLLSEEEVEKEPVAEDLKAAGSRPAAPSLDDEAEWGVKTATVHDGPKAFNDPDRTIIIDKGADLKSAVDNGGNAEMPDGRRKKNKTYNVSGPNWVFWICLVIILIPCCVFGYIILQARQTTSTPLVGSRFEGDLNPAITDDDMAKLTTAVKALDGVENCYIETKVATTRVIVDAKDDISHEDLSALTANIYNAVDAALPIATYYTNTGDTVMYDLEISVYNNLDYDPAGDPAFMMFDIVKNAKMETAITQEVSTPKNATLAAKLLQDVKDRDAAEKNTDAGGTDGQDTTDTTGTDGTGTEG